MSHPTFLYGTAWKEIETERLTRQAIEQGFRGIDTANQRKHYDEASVGRAIRSALEAGLVTRDELFIQTKFTFLAGQDQRLPYDPRAPIADQVAQSFASSLAHLHLESLDSYVLHGPSMRTRLGDDDWNAWQAMESLYAEGKTRQLGISNVSLEQLQALCEGAKVSPHFVQNRCYAMLGWDYEIREFCHDRNIVYQGFSLLTANRNELQSPQIGEIARRHGRTIGQIVFRFAIDIGMLPLTGTTSAQHMREDLDVATFRLELAEIDTIERIALR